MTAVVPDPATTDWVPLGGVGGGALVPVQEITLAADGAIDFQNIPQTYRHLMIEASLRGAFAVGEHWLGVRFNGDSGANYDYGSAYSNAATVQGVEGHAVTYGRSGYALFSTGAAGRWAPNMIEIPDYTNTARQKSGLGRAYVGGTTVALMMNCGFNWRNTAAINRIQIVPDPAAAGNWLAGSSATLYGIAPPGLTTPLGGAYYGSSPPASPYDGQEWIYPAGSGVLLRFRYNASSVLAEKWEYLGGNVPSEVPTAETLSSATFVDLATVGPQAVAPRSGAYMIEFGFEGVTPSGVAYLIGAVKLGAAATSDTQGATVQYPAGAASLIGSRAMLATLAAGDLVKLQYRITAGSVTIRNRWLKLTPVRVS